MAATRRWNELKEEDEAEGGGGAAGDVIEMTGRSATGSMTSPTGIEAVPSDVVQAAAVASSKSNRARGRASGTDGRVVVVTEDEAMAEAEAAREQEEEKQLLLEAKRLEEEGRGKGVFDRVKRKLAQRKARKMRLVRSDALQQLKKRLKKKMSLVSFGMYIVFILVYFSVCLAQVRVTDMFTLQSALRDYTLSKATYSSVGFENISSMEQLWTWMETTLLDLLFPRSVWYNGDPLPPDKRGFLLEFNKLVGGFRLRQRRILVNGEDCVSSRRFENIYPDCFPTTFKGNQETESFGPSYEPSKYEWLWDPQGGAYHISIPAAQDARGLATNILSELKSDLWMDRSTRDISFNFLVYNGNYRMFSLVSATIAFLPTGLLTRSISFFTFRMEMYATYTDYVRLAFEIVILLIILVSLWNELKEMFLNDRHRMTLRMRLERYFLSFWNWVNLALLTALIVVLGMYLYMVTAPRYQDLKLNNAMLSQRQYDAVVSYGIMWRRYLELNAACVLLFLFTIFKFISESPEYGVLVRTITRSGPNLVKFLGVFLVIAVAFTVMGLLLFGHTVKEWSSLWEASQEFTVMLAENSGYDLIKGTSNVAFVFYFVFVFIVFFILVNIILAVLMDSYAALQIELEKLKRDQRDSERVQYSVGEELMYQIIRTPVLKQILKLTTSLGDGFLSSEQMMVMLDEPELLKLVTKRYPMPTVLNPNPTPLEIMYLDDLEAVHGADNALFIMNQLGQLLTGLDSDDTVQPEWSPEHMDKLMGEEEIDDELDEPVGETNLALSRRHYTLLARETSVTSTGVSTDGENPRLPSARRGAHDEDDAVTERLKFLMSQNQQLSSSLALLSDHVQGLQSGQTLIPGIPERRGGAIEVDNEVDENKIISIAGESRSAQLLPGSVSEVGASSSFVAFPYPKNEKAMRRWIKLVARITAPEFDLD